MADDLTFLVGFKGLNQAVAQLRGFGAQVKTQTMQMGKSFGGLGSAVKGVASGIPGSSRS